MYMVRIEDLTKTTTLHTHTRRDTETKRGSEILEHKAVAQNFLQHTLQLQTSCNIKVYIQIDHPFFKNLIKYYCFLFSERIQNNPSEKLGGFFILYLVNCVGNAVYSNLHISLSCSCLFSLKIANLLPTLDQKSTYTLRSDHK